MKKVIIITFAIIFIPIIFFSCKKQEQKEQPAYIFKDFVNVRQEPNKTGKVLLQFRIGRKIEVFRTDHSEEIDGKIDYWYKIKLYKQDGYVWGGLITKEIAIDKGADVNAKDNYGKTPLMSHLTPEIAKLLIESGADVNAKDKYGETPLMLALHYYHNPEIAKLLIERGADINAKSNFGNTALMYAGSYLEVAKMLIEKGADVNAKDKDGTTVLMCASDTEVVKLLIERGADVNAKDKNGETAFMLALAHDKVGAVKGFSEKGVIDLNAKDSVGLTMLMHAVILAQKSAYNGLRKMKMLLEIGVDVNARDNYGRTALILAVMEPYNPIMLFGSGDDGRGPSFEEMEGIVLQHYKEIISPLIERGADINAKENNGTTVLHLAVMRGGEIEGKGLVKFFIEKGTDVNVKDNRGVTALMLAKEKGYTEIIKLLKAAGAKE